MFSWKSGRSVCGNLATFCCSRHEKMVICRSEGCESITTRRRRRRRWSLRRNCSLGTCKCPSFRVCCNRKEPQFLHQITTFLRKHLYFSPSRKKRLSVRKTRKGGHLRGPRLQFLLRDQQDLRLRCVVVDSQPCDRQITTFSRLLQHKPVKFSQTERPLFQQNMKFSHF